DPPRRVVDERRQDAAQDAEEPDRHREEEDEEQRDEERVGRPVSEVGDEEEESPAHEEPEERAAQDPDARPDGQVRPEDRVARADGADEELLERVLEVPPPPQVLAQVGRALRIAPVHAYCLLSRTKSANPSSTAARERKSASEAFAVSTRSRAIERASATGQIVANGIFPPSFRASLPVSAGSPSASSTSSTIWNARPTFFAYATSASRSAALAPQRTAEPRSAYMKRLPVFRLWMNSSRSRLGAERILDSSRS